MTKPEKEDKNLWKCSKTTTSLPKKNKTKYLDKSNCIETKVQKLSK